MGQVCVKEPQDVQAEIGIGSLVLARGQKRVPVFYRDLLEEIKTVRHHPAKLSSAIFEAYELLTREELDRFCYPGRIYWLEALYIRSHTRYLANPLESYNILTLFPPAQFFTYVPYPEIQTNFTILMVIKLLSVFLTCLWLYHFSCQKILTLS